MFDDLVKQFISSSAAQDAVRQLAGLGVTKDKAKEAIAVSATEAAGHLEGGRGKGLAGILGAVGRVFKGGAPKELSPQAIEAVAEVVVTRTGLSPTMARTAVDLVVPRLLEFVKEALGKGAAAAP